MDTVTPRIVLASSSPRRKMLLEQLGIPFEIITSDVDEQIDSPTGAIQLVESLALKKAQAVALSLSQCIVIGADTIVVDDQGMLGKPQDEADAYRMLARLSGKVHTVTTGVAVVAAQSSSPILVNHETTDVKIARLSDLDIKHYIRTGEPLDKAGAYAIQGKGAMLVEWVRGCYNNVVGLPLFLLLKMLKQVNGGIDRLLFSDGNYY